MTNLAEARRDFELLQVEYEKVLIVNQQSGSIDLLFPRHNRSLLVPITREMRSLINHLQAQCKLYNLEASRCKKQCKEFEDELNKLKSKQDTNNHHTLHQQLSIPVSEPTSAGPLHESPTSKDDTLNPTEVGHLASISLSNGSPFSER